jgi:hypothetical protein
VIRVGSDSHARTSRNDEILGDKSDSSYRQQNSKLKTTTATSYMHLIDGIAITLEFLRSI